MYEYQLATFPSHHLDNIQNHLNSLARQGYRLINLFTWEENLQIQPDVSHAVFVLEREIPDDPGQ